VGIFAQPANAEDLKTKLESQGFPVYIETRVQVGPFTDRKEADKVREKLKAMGMATVFIAQ
jgi:DedD protein